MKVYKEQPNPIFKSGLNKKLIKDFNRINPKSIEAEFREFGVNANFNNNAPLAGCFALSVNILGEIAARYHLPFNFPPPEIRVYNPNELITPLRARGFCISDTKQVIKGEAPFIGTSVFMENSTESINYINFRRDLEYFFRACSSSHFLSDTLHELFHSIQCSIIYAKEGYDGACPVLRKLYTAQSANGTAKLDEISNIKYSKKEIMEIRKYLGNYAANTHNALEVFAETMTKITALSLNQKLEPIKNPMDNLKSAPKFIKKLIEETFSL